ncbi:PAS domain S-box protein [Marivirga arenosa]|uniref:histidine kinase n=1 Tax=Marivirga arenosa TaxID=3059076 RepID=A0AA51N5S7_9BACT|nr:PAS domain S-box protein [Marivirga sp. ABR2-2]WMN06714.1 PAS domain S-box protein [Marivirga sp. ABR2-2]
MKKLKHKLYECLNQNPIVFDLINDLATDGYCFWEQGDSDKVLIDSKLAKTIHLVSSLKNNLDEVETVKGHFLDVLTKEVIKKNKEKPSDKNINELTLFHSSGKISIHFYCCTDFKNQTYFLAALQYQNEINESIDKISNKLDLAIWQWNIQTNELIVNEKWANIIGYSLKELEPVTVEKFLNITHPDDGEYALNKARNYFSGITNEYFTEIRMRHKNGTWRWVLTKGKVVSRTKSGEVEWFIGSHLDITERKLQEQEADILSLVPLNSTNSIVITDDNGCIIFVNKSFERLTGYELEEVIGKKPGHFLQGENTDLKDIQAFREKLLAGKPFNQTILNYSKSGLEYIVSCDVSPVFNDKGDVIKYIAIQTDITENIKNHEFLSTFKTTLDQTDDCIFIFNEDDLQFSYVNQGAVKMMGYSEEELYELHPYDIKPEYPYEKFQDLIKPLKSGELANKRFRTFHRIKSGEVIPVEVFLQLIRRENFKSQFVAIVHDISEELERQKMLEELSLVAEKTTNLVIITDENGYIEYVNAAFEKKTKYTLNEVIGKKPGSFLHGPKTNPSDIKANRIGIKKREPFTQEILNYTKSGDTYWVSITFNPVYDKDGKLIKFIAIESDITERKIQEERLTESEERLKFVLEASEIGYWDWNLETNKLTVNEKWFEMLGYSSSDFDPTIENWHSLVHKDDLIKLDKIIETIFPDPTKGEFSVELRAKHRFGHYVWILNRGAVVERKKDGSPKRVSGMHLEISMRKKLENELEEEREFLNHVINAKALSLIIINKYGEITFANSGAENILGLEKTKILEKAYNDPDWNSITLDGKPYPEEELPFVRVMRTKKPVKDIQHGLTWSNGKIKYISVSGAPFTIDNGEIQDVIFSVSDITERIYAEKKLFDTQFRMENILKDISDVIWSVDLSDENMNYITPSIKKLTGYNTEYYLDGFSEDKWKANIVKSDLAEYEKGLKELKEKGFYEAEYRIKTKEGDLKWILNKGKFIYVNGEAVRMDGIISDISKRKESENEIERYLKIAEDQNNRLKNFTYIVSHNLRSHSANIQGLMYLINKKFPELSENEYLRMLNIASTKLDETLHHLNNVVSVVSSTDDMKVINLAESIKSFQDTFQNFIQKSNVTIINDVPKNINVYAVPAFLESIISNLLTNALKYKDKNKPNSYVKVKSRNFNGIVIITVEDNGLGIDLDKYGNKLFGMFKTFHAQKHSRGLGLFLTKNQIESMGGKIEVESKVGVGSKFKVYLKDGNI